MTSSPPPAPTVESAPLSPVDSSMLTVLIPAFNEELGLPATLEALAQTVALERAKILVIDDGSSDATAAIAQAYPRVTVLRHKNNQGYGAAIKTGALQARTPYIAWFDADNQHRASDLASMFRTCVSGGYDAVIGERQAGSDTPASRRPGKAVLRLATRFVVNHPIRDINCGLRVFRRDLLLAYLPLLPDGFSASATSLLLFIKRKRYFCFFPVLTARREGSSAVRQLRDGFATLHLIMRILFLFSAFRTFGILAAFLALSGLIYGLLVALVEGQGVPVLASLLISSGLLVLCVGILSDQISALRLETLERTGDRGDRFF
jgi:glycosyltransferase involved in cell wall biosynthesis